MALSLIQLLRQLTTAEITASALYVSLDLRTLFVSDYKASDKATPPYEIKAGETAYRRLTPLYFCWIKSQLQFLQSLHHQGKLKPNIFRIWGIRYGRIKEYCRTKFGEELTTLDLPSFFANIKPSDIVDIAGDLEMSNSFFLSTPYIFPRPVSFDDVSKPLNFSDEQMKEIALQIAPKVYGNLMEAVKLYYPEYCTAVNATASLLWIYVAWKMFTRVANIFSSVTRFEKIDYRLRDATIKTLTDYFTGIFKVSPLKSLSEDTRERAGINIREDFAA